MGVGFDSGLSGFAFTCIILLFLLHTPIAYPGKAWKLAAQALKKKADWSILDSKKVGAFTQQSVRTCETGPSKKYQLAQTRTLCCFVQEWPSGHSRGALCREPFAKLRSVGVSPRSCDCAGKTYRFELALNPIFAVMQINSEIGP